ncbi:MAG: hypothetical protein AAFU73_19510 [Planctomycetota bacterium]
MLHRSILALLALCLASCRGDGVVSQAPVQPAGPLVVHPVYQTAFDAVKAALDAEDTAVAASTLRRLRARLEADLETAPGFDEARRSVGAQGSERTGGGPREAAVLAGLAPSRESVEAGLRVADGFERVVEGRLRMEALTPTLELVRSAEGELVDVVLVARSTWSFPLTLEPGPGVLRVRRTSIEPRTGDLAVDASESTIADPPVLEVPPGGVARLRIAQVAIEVPVGAIATEMTTRLSLNSGAVVEKGRRYPARDFTVTPSARTDFPAWVPLGYLEPADLVGLVERGDAPLPAILERTVRIAPARRGETLDMLGLAAETLPPQALRPAMPALRWLSGDSSLQLDERGWKVWLAQRLEERRAGGPVPR